MGGPVKLGSFGPSSQIERAVIADRFSGAPLIGHRIVPLEFIVLLNKELVDGQPYGLAASIIFMLEELRKRFDLKKAGTLWPVKLNLISRKNDRGNPVAIPTIVETTIQALGEVIEAFPPGSGLDLSPRVQIEARRRLRLRFSPAADARMIQRRIEAVKGIQYAEIVRAATIPMRPAISDPPNIGVVDPTAKRASINADWAVEEVGRPKLARGLDNIAILDSGIDLKHPAFKDNGNVWCSDPESRIDPSGHGTFVAGIIVGKAAIVDPKFKIPVDSTSNTIDGMLPDSKAWICSVVDPVGVNLGGNRLSYFVDPGWYSWALNQIADAHEFAQNTNLKKIQVVNLSLGSGVYSPTEAADIKRLVDLNIAIVAASGNKTDWSNDLLYPAALPGVIAVGATQYRNKLKELWVGTRSGSISREIDITAPGEAIFSTVPLTPSAMGIQFSGWSSGTSFAAPFVTAVAAAWISINGPQKSSDILVGIGKGASQDSWPTVVWT